MLGAVLVVLNVLVAVFAPAIGRWEPQRLDVQARLAPPTASHWMGTDDVGRDVWSRVIHGTRLSMIVGGAVVALSFVGGIVFGLLGGYYRPLDNVLMRIMDGFMAFPGIILAIAMMAVPGAERGERHRGARHRVRAAGGAHRARLGAGDPRDALRRGRAGPGRRPT